MASFTIADLVLFRNRQIQANEKIALCLWKLEALMVVVLTTNGFFELTKSTMHYYFSIAADLIKELIQLNQTNLFNLLHEE